MGRAHSKPSLVLWLSMSFLWCKFLRYPNTANQREITMRHTGVRDVLCSSLPNRENKKRYVDPNFPYPGRCS